MKSEEKKHRLCWNSSIKMLMWFLQELKKNLIHCKQKSLLKIFQILKCEPRKKHPILLNLRQKRCREEIFSSIVSIQPTVFVLVCFLG